MSSYNKVMLMGNLTRDPQVKYLPTQTVVAEFGIAVNRKFKTATGEDREEVTFVDCTAFGRVAETVSQYFTKGKPIFIDGRLKYDQWDDKQGGGKRSKLTVVVENFQFIGGRDQGDERADDPPPRQRPDHRGPLEAPAPPMFRTGGKPKREPAPVPFGDEQHFDEPDIPFAWEGRAGGPV